ncbi:extracellular solute-binding protein [Lapillicoccus jejuensis]|uniref:Carbohydrate ABC transporter substrate-binding protein (CUT1 family) n=1 Tax=Lapillicoccus jejuensis TaxID=402171 RepID=A0A542E585_9MICO|nr:extracellular solute-binding protein [Lapillicoccus jejuensis]TQJ10485.1 carbohydrate ABC transporter substrate-binding protein (CUT1 family) [Lapillicoccus jejuensis]
MRFSRPLVPVVAAAALAMVSLTACGGGSSSGSGGGGGKLDVFLASQPNYPTQFQQWSSDVKAKFKAATGADLTIETFSSAADETTKIQASVVSGNGPDVYQLGTTFTPVAYGTKAFHTLTDADWQKVGGKDQYMPESLGMSGPDSSTQIGIPVAIRPFGMVYNTEMFKAAGITSPPTTWDDLVAAGKKLTTGDQYGLAIGYADSYDPWKFIWSLTEQQGGSFVSKDLKTAQLNSPQVKTAVADYFGMLTKDKVVDPKSVGWKDADALTAFATGKAAVFPMATATSIPTLEKSSVKGKYAFAPLPDVPFGATSRPSGAPAAQTIVSGDNIAIASYTKNLDLALAYVKIVSSPEMQQKQYEYFGNLPSNQSAFQKVADSNPLLAPFIDAEKGATPTAFTGGWADIQNGLTNVVVQSLPSLQSGAVDGSATASLLEAANTKAQSSLTRAAR